MPKVAISCNKLPQDAKKFQKVAKKLPKVATSCQKLLKVAKSCQQLTQVAKSCHMYAFNCVRHCVLSLSQLFAALCVHNCVRHWVLTVACGNVHSQLIVSGIVNCVRQCLVWPVVEEVMSQGQERLSTQEGLIMEPLFQWSKAKGNRIRGRLSTCLMV